MRMRKISGRKELRTFWRKVRSLNSAEGMRRDVLFGSKVKSHRKMK